MALFLDTEFTALDARSELISLALVDDGARALYLERNDLDPSGLSAWLNTHVLPALHRPPDDRSTVVPAHSPALEADYGRGSTGELGTWLRDWLAPYRGETVWVDMGCWDWLHTVQLLGGGLELPASIEMYPAEFSTLLRARGMCFDHPRAEIAPFNGRAHRALDDARHLRDCVGALANP